MKHSHEEKWQIDDLFEMRYHARRSLSARAQLPDRREMLAEMEPVIVRALL